MKRAVKKRIDPDDASRTAGLPSALASSRVPHRP